MNILVGLDLIAKVNWLKKISFLNGILSYPSLDSHKVFAKNGFWSITAVHVK